MDRRRARSPGRRTAPGYCPAAAVPPPARRAASSRRAARRCRRPARRPGRSRGAAPAAIPPVANAAAVPRPLPRCAAISYCRPVASWICCSFASDALTWALAESRSALCWSTVCCVAAPVRSSCWLRARSLAIGPVWRACPPGRPAPGRSRSPGPAFSRLASRSCASASVAAAWSARGADRRRRPARTVAPRRPPARRDAPTG